LNNKTIIKNAKIVNYDKVLEGDILIDNSKIIEIGTSLKHENAIQIIEAEGKYVFPGFIDMHVHLREPGQEEKETLLSGLSAAVHGGITGVCCMPNTNPIVDNEYYVKFLIDKAWEINKARLFPIGAITKQSKGEEISEMVSMIKAGAVAFSDDGVAVSNMLVLRRALQYIKPYNKPLILHCEDKQLSVDGAMNEGETATKLGLPGIHNVAEEAYIAQSIETAKYFGKVHIAHVSTKGSVELIRFAKQRNIAITAETAPHYFVLTEKNVGSYNTNAKMNPPLRTEEDRRAIIEGLRDGTIDAIASDHAPHTVDDKNKEFNQALFGIIGLETLIMLSLKVLVQEEGFTLSQIAKLCSYNPASILGIKAGYLKAGTVADLTIVDLNRKWSLDENYFYSKSKNTPFIGWQGVGKAELTMVNGIVVWQEKG